MVDFYISVIKRYRKELLKLSTLIVADVFFSTDTSLSGEEVLLYYRTRFQIEFCFRDAKGYTGLMDCRLAISGNSILLSMLRSHH